MSHNDYAKFAADLLAPVEGAWKADLIAYYERYAESDLRDFFAELDRAPERANPYTYLYVSVARDESETYKVLNGQVLVAKRAAGKITVNLQKAQQDAERAFAMARNAFIVRFAEKLTVILGGLPCSVGGVLRFNRLITGSLTIAAEGLEATVEAGLKYNYRYGEHSANRSLTVYSQYPFLVRLAKVAGKVLRGPSAGEVAFALRGVNPELVAVAAKVEAKEAKAARAQAVRLLERRKSFLSDVCSDFRWNAMTRENYGVEQSDKHLADKLAKHAETAKRLGVEVPQTFADAKAAMKAAREAHKAAKAAL
jgi:hypothetical protein